MTRCPASCRLKNKREKDQLNHILANKTTKNLEAQFNFWVHIEEVPESQLEPTKTKGPPGFACLDLDEVDQGD